MLEGPEVFSLGGMRICASALFSMKEAAFIPHSSPRRVGRVLDLSRMDLSLMQACGGRDAGLHDYMTAGVHGRDALDLSGLQFAPLIDDQLTTRLRDSPAQR
jgi:hypothetical protein